ncbi:Glutamyl aminopeptidase [Temnothorax longispinosus]|uniref:Glutamyl aminopeptidase n=1 Tax=Temnothorax longispinosus TaxID=300112 RepID=A0A4S2KPI2_9HYME|nr:Glutamyl aminopeptidase [Temnothorax longispinosus]
MPIQAKYEDEDDDGSMWTHFRTTPPMSTYQVSVVLLNFCRVQINENINLWCAKCSKLPSLNYAKRVIEVITSHLESEFNEIKIPKIDHIVFPNLQYNGISKWGFAFYSEADLICIEKFDPIMRQIEVARSIALKITSQWFGNVLSPAWWSQFWLYDGLAILFGEEAVVKNTMRELISKTLEILRFEESPVENDFIKLLRLEIVKWACTLELPKCLEKAKSNLIEHLEDPEKK